MEKTRKYNNLSSNTSMERNLTGIDRRKYNYYVTRSQNDVINNGTEQSSQETFFKKGRKRRERRKKMASIPLQENNTRIDIETNDSNKSRSLHLANNTSILPETADLSSTSTEEDKGPSNTIDKNTYPSKNLFKKDTEKVSGTKKKEYKKTFNSLQQDDQRTEINNLIDKVQSLQFVNKKYNHNAFVSSKTADLPTIAKHNTEDTNNTSISTVESLSTEDIRETSCMNKQRDKKVCNSSQKNIKQMGLKTNVSKGKADSLQLINNCNNVSPKPTDLPSTNAVEHESNEDTNDKGISTSENSKFIFFDIDYEFHEANHAIIDTFAINIYFSYANDKKSYCLVCDKTFQVQNNHYLRKNLCSHIQSDNHVKLLSQMIEEDKKFLKAGKLFSKLGLARECMRSKNDIIECLLCNSNNFIIKIQNDDLSLHEHILSSKHQNFKMSWTGPVKSILRDVHHHFRSMYNAKKYCCEFCNYESVSEIYFAKHLRVPHHTSRLVQIPDHTEKFKFHYCAACLLLWFGSSDMFDRHCEQIEHKRRITYGSDLDNLSEEIVELLITCNQKAEILLAQSNSVCFDKTIDYILCDLINDIRSYISHVYAYPFGSRISELGLPDSDVDIFLDCGNMYEGENPLQYHYQDLITLLVYYLSLNKTMWKVQEMILHSRTPIIKVQHISSGFICDISVTNGLAVENTKLIKCFNHAFPLCRKMILFLKQWLHSCGLSGSHLITSYALTWCVIFYLQTLLVLPSISQLIKLKNSSWKINGWEVGVSYSFPVRRINHTFEELLLGFFTFYADFTYKNHVICPLLGQPIEKSAFNSLSKLPQDMDPYITNIYDACYGHGKPQTFFISPLCVQDPFDLSHNLTKAMHNRKLEKFKKNCNYSAKILKKTFPYLMLPS